MTLATPWLSEQVYDAFSGYYTHNPFLTIHH
jgi:hypothetical protein